MTGRSLSAPGAARRTWGFKAVRSRFGRGLEWRKPEIIRPPEGTLGNLMQQWAHASSVFRHYPIGCEDRRRCRDDARLPGDRRSGGRRLWQKKVRALVCSSTSAWCWHTVSPMELRTLSTYAASWSRDLTSAAGIRLATEEWREAKTGLSPQDRTDFGPAGVQSVKPQCIGSSSTGGFRATLLLYAAMYVSFGRIHPVPQ